MGAGAEPPEPPPPHFNHSEVVFKLGDSSCLKFLNQHPWMHLNLNTILYTQGSPIRDSCTAVSTVRSDGLNFLVYCGY